MKECGAVRAFFVAVANLEIVTVFPRGIGPKLRSPKNNLWARLRNATEKVLIEDCRRRKREEEGRRKICQERRGPQG
jgi:hypothetical protein